MVHGASLARVGAHVTKLLQRIQATIQWEKRFEGCTRLERFHAEQNCEIIIAADEYYRKMIMEPAGSQATWNTRDQHMCTTLLRLKEHFKNPKIVVWAHNSHVGDATATARGGVNFERNETWNLGQMVRATFQDTFVVGFYTYGGHVVAASRWGGKKEEMTLRDALPGSYEHAFHRLECDRFFARTTTTTTTTRHDFTSYDPPALPCTFERVHPDVVVTTGRDASVSTRTRLEDNRFHAVERWRHPRTGTLRLLTADGTKWVTEFVPHGSITVHCRPERNDASATKPTIETILSGEPRLQRWVGVQYHPDTEVRSHYGEIVMRDCYDMIVFVDRTTALRPALSASSRSESARPSAACTKRLMKEYRRLLRRPIPGIRTHPLESNLLEWHFLMTCSQAPYEGGEYHGVLEFPPAYPMRPPAIKMLTPSGRFEIATRLCLSISDYHPESWNPSGASRPTSFPLVSCSPPAHPCIV